MDILDDERERRQHIKRFARLRRAPLARPITMKALARLANLCYKRVNRHLDGRPGLVRFTANERRRLTVALDRFEAIALLDRVGRVA